MKTITRHSILKTTKLAFLGAGLLISATASASSIQGGHIWTPHLLQAKFYIFDDFNKVKDCSHIFGL